MCVCVCVFPGAREQSWLSVSAATAMDTVACGEVSGCHLWASPDTRVRLCDTISSKSLRGVCWVTQLRSIRTLWGSECGNGRHFVRVWGFAAPDAPCLSNHKDLVKCFRLIQYWKHQYHSNELNVYTTFPKTDKSWIRNDELITLSRLNPYHGQIVSEIHDAKVTNNGKLFFLLFMWIGKLHKL